MSLVDCISLTSTSAEDFFTKYVDKRLPCHFKDQFNKGWGIDKWTNAYLKRKCDADVKVEFRDSPKDRFGQGNEIQMPFNKFIQEMEDGSELYYMTTQKLKYSAEGQASILSPPMCDLDEDFPLNPSLMGNLIVQNINMWMGASTEPVTSGLHHDYHDNLYIVLRGVKQLTLFAPEEHPNMYTVGELQHLHSNGRVNYKGCLTRADGADVGAEKALQASLNLEKAMLSVEHNEGQESGDESDIENALEDLLDAQIACNDNDEFSYSDECDEDEEESDGGDDISLDLPIPRHVLTVDKRKRDCCKEEGQNNDESEDDDSSDAVRKKHKEMSRNNIVEDTLATSGSPPPNFSRIDTSLPNNILSEKFPKFVEARSRGAEYSVTLKPGEMLYLPAGWFHEVKSTGSPPLGHMAMNYWFHPPDNHQFEAPYCSNFWKKDWDLRVISSK